MCDVNLIQGHLTRINGTLSLNLGGGGGVLHSDFVMQRLLEAHSLQNKSCCFYPDSP